MYICIIQGIYWGFIYVYIYIYRVYFGVILG